MEPLPPGPRAAWATWAGSPGRVRRAPAPAEAPDPGLDPLSPVMSLDAEARLSRLHRMEVAARLDLLRAQKLRALLSQRPGEPLPQASFSRAPAPVFAVSGPADPRGQVVYSLSKYAGAIGRSWARSGLGSALGSGLGLSGGSLRPGGVGGGARGGGVEGAEGAEGEDGAEAAMAAEAAEVAEAAAGAVAETAGAAADAGAAPVTPGGPRLPAATPATSLRMTRSAIHEKVYRSVVNTAALEERSVRFDEPPEPAGPAPGLTPGAGPRAPPGPALAADAPLTPAELGLSAALASAVLAASRASGPALGSAPGSGAAPGPRSPGGGLAASPAPGRTPRLANSAVHVPEGASPGPETGRRSRVTFAEGREGREHREGPAVPPRDYCSGLPEEASLEVYLRHLRGPARPPAAEAAQGPLCVDVLTEFLHGGLQGSPAEAGLGGPGGLGGLGGAASPRPGSFEAPQHASTLQIVQLARPAQSGLSTPSAPSLPSGPSGQSGQSGQSGRSGHSGHGGHPSHSARAPHSPHSAHSAHSTRSVRSLLPREAPRPRGPAGAALPSGLFSSPPSGAGDASSAIINTYEPSWDAGLLGPRRGPPPESPGRAARPAAREAEDGDATPYALAGPSGASLDAPVAVSRHLFGASGLEAPARPWAMSPCDERSEDGPGGRGAARSLARSPAHAPGLQEPAGAAAPARPALDEELEGVSSIVHPDAGRGPSGGRPGGAASASALENPESQSSCLRGGLSDLEIDGAGPGKSGRASESSEHLDPADKGADEANLNTLTSSDHSISLFYPLGRGSGSASRVEGRARALLAQASTLAARGAAGLRPEPPGEAPLNSSTLNRDPRPNTQASVLETSRTAGPAPGAGAAP